MTRLSLTAAMKSIYRLLILILLSSNLEELGQNPSTIFLLYCLVLWSSPGAGVKLSLELDRAKQWSPLTLHLKKRAANFFQYGFAGKD